MYLRILVSDVVFLLLVIQFVRWFGKVSNMTRVDVINGTDRQVCYDDLGAPDGYGHMTCVNRV